MDMASEVSVKAKSAKLLIEDALEELGVRLPLIDQMYRAKSPY
jgi:hypothetical protein